MYHSGTTRFRVAAFGLALLGLSFAITGCGNKFFDPTQIGRFRPVPKVNVILSSLGVAEEEPPAWEKAEQPKPIDAIDYEKDYVFGSGDVVRVSIFELLQQGGLFSINLSVTETGKISIPEAGVVQAAGLTESQLEDEIRGILSPGILKDPTVTVTLMSSQYRTFSILGDGIPGSGRYGIPRYDFRLLDALATAGGISQFNISNVYVTRRVTGREPLGQKQTEKTETEQQLDDMFPRQQDMIEIVAPSAEYRPEQALIIGTRPGQTPRPSRMGLQKWQVGSCTSWPSAGRT